IVLNNTLDAVEDGRLALLGFFDGLALDAQPIHRLEVIFEELVTNIVRHGFRPGSGQSIHVRATASPGLVELTFEDDGTPFNPLLAPPPAPYTTLETARIGGRGIPLVTSLSSSVRYVTPVPDGAFKPTNRLVLTVSTAA
ncbi:MAG: ATP-binding protein, partial [Caulobacteraceae bacterium]